MLPEDDTAITAELERREEQRRKVESAEMRRKSKKDKEKSGEDTENNQDEPEIVEKSSKWKEQHMAMAESRL